MTSKGIFQFSELFLLTDNSTAEATFYKGTSSSRELFNLILQLRKFQMDTGAFFHVLLVSGKCMIAQETDGLSREPLIRRCCQELPCFTIYRCTSLRWFVNPPFRNGFTLGLPQVMFLLLGSRLWIGVTLVTKLLVAIGAHLQRPQMQP
jgi:hypothetical protein